MPESKTMRMFRLVRQVAAPGAKLLSTIAGLARAMVVFLVNTVAKSL